MKRDYGYATEKPFNFAGLLLERLNERFNDANLAAMEGDAHRWYRILITIKNAIVFKLEPYKDKEGNEVDELKDLEKALSDIKTELMAGAKQNREVYYFNVEQKLMVAEKMIVILMAKYELYYPYKDKQLWQDDVGGMYR